MVEMLEANSAAPLYQTLQAATGQKIVVTGFLTFPDRSQSNEENTGYIYNNGNLINGIDFNIVHRLQLFFISRNTNGHLHLRPELRFHKR